MNLIFFIIYIVWTFWIVFKPAHIPSSYILAIIILSTTAGLYIDRLEIDILKNQVKTLEQKIQTLETPKK